MSRRSSPFSAPWRAVLVATSLLAPVATLPAQNAAAPASTPPQLEAALTKKSRGDDAGAAIALAEFAEQLAATPAADAATRTAAEGAAAMAFELCGRSLLDRAIADRLLALRDAPLFRSDLAARDQVGLFGLEYHRELRQNGAAALARELGCIDDFWICGPFDNDRGAAFARTLPPETQFDLDASYPGKLRPVLWRRLTGVAKTGRLDLFAVLRPAQQVACLVATNLRAERDADVALHLGTAGSYEIRLGGRVVARRDVERPHAFDQDVIGVHLLAGDNLLLLKLCHQEAGQFALSLRVRAPLGGDAAGVRVRSEPDVLRTAAAAAATTGAAEAAPKAVAVSNGARSRPDGATARGLDAFWLASLWFQRSAFAENDRQDRVLAERAVADLPNVAQARLLLASTRIRTTSSDADVDDNERRADYEAILAADPDHVEAHVQLGQMLLFGTRLRTAAEEHARAALRVCPTNQPARLLLAYALQNRGQTAQSRRERLAAATAANATMPAILETLYDRDNLASSVQRDLRHRALQLSRGRPRLGAIKEMFGAGEDDEAVAALASLAEDEPLFRDVYELRADRCEAAGDFAGALQQYSAWLQLCPDDDDALAAQSRLHGRLGHPDEQLETLRAAIECNPNRRDDQRYLEYLAAEAVPFYAAWKVDAAPLLTVPTPEASTAGLDAVYHLLRQRVVRAHKNGTTSEYVHECVRILTTAGARAFANYQLRHYRGEQRARLLAVTVHKADGTKEEPRLRGGSVALPSLGPGDVVEIEGRVDDQAPTFFGDYFGLVHYFAAPDGTAVHRAELVVVAETGREYRYQLANGAPEPTIGSADDGAKTFAFHLDDIARDVVEPYRPEPRERAPLVRFSTFGDWSAFANWWWNLIRGQIETTEPMRQRVRELCTGLTTPAQKIDALYRFVTTDVRYEAWEFGVHGYKPYSTAVIYERRHGDCKDKALLLCALLSEIGIQAKPVLIYADDRRTEDDLSLPMVQHFNHCIAWLPAQDGVPEQFLDGTAIWHPSDTTPDMDQGAKVLVVDRGNAMLKQVPFVAVADNLDEITYDIELRADGSATARMVETPTRNQAVPLRQALATEPARRREHVERNLVGQFGAVELGDLACSDPLRADEPVRLQVDFRVPTLGQVQSGQWQLPSTFGSESLAELAAEPERRSPLLLGVPRRDLRRVTYHLPAGYRLATLPTSTSRQHPFGGFAVDWRAEGDRVVVERVVNIASPRIAPNDYAAFRDFVTAIGAADAQRIVLQKENR